MNQEQLKLLKKHDEGSCRDITFSKLSLSKSKNALRWYCDLYKSDFGNAELNNNSFQINPIDFFDKHYQSMQINGENGNEIIKELQLFISPEEGDSYFLELTFFPKDLNITSDSLDKINAWLRTMEQKIEPEEYYIRYCNASWEYGDVSDSSGVIFYKR